MREADMETIGRLIARVLADHKNDSVLAEVRRDVARLCGRFPLYASRLEAYDRALARA
jgi:glycine hydroxymethyltransferase